MDRKRINVQKMKYFMGKIVLLILEIIVIGLSMNFYSQAEENSENREQQAVQRYELQYEKPDGNLEYYSKRPGIKIVHKDLDCITKYEFATADGTVLKGELEKENQEIQIISSQMKEGTNHLKVWMEKPRVDESNKQDESDKNEPDKDESDKDESDKGEFDKKDESDNEDKSNKTDESDGKITWEVMEDTIQTVDFKVDTKAPEIASVTYQQDEGLDVIYCNRPLEIVVTGKDSGSGVAGVIYKLCGGEEQYAKGSECRIQIADGYEGNVTVWSIDLAGNKSEECVTKNIVCDTNKPEIQVSAPKGFDTWYQQDFQVIVNVKDERLTSGLARVSGYLNGELARKKIFNRADTNPETEVSFSIPITEETEKGGPISIQVEAVDKSGNACSVEKTVYLDKTAPTIDVSGAENGMITSNDCIVEVVVSDHNVMKECQVVAMAKDIEGNSMEVPVEKKTEKEYAYEIAAKADGVYNLQVKGMDVAGNCVQKELQFTIDKENPVIRYVEQLHGTYVQHFRWLYEPGEMIRDFSSYEYRMELDGQLFGANQEMEKEGQHILRVLAEDAAGNTSSSEAVFYVDHTAPMIVTDGIQNGKNYKSHAELTISLEQELDFVTAIHINGISQKINQNSQVFQFPFDVGKYEVKIYAEDLAGNAAVKRILFEVKEEKNIVTSIMKPMKKVLGLAQNQKNVVDRNNAGITKTKKLWAFWFMGIAGCVMLSGTIFIVLVKIKNKAGNKKTP